MSKETEVLYLIFTLELSPPFFLVRDPYEVNFVNIYNKFSKQIGFYEKDEKCVCTLYNTDVSLFNKIKQTFNLDEISHDDAYHIAKHLYIWMVDNFPEKIDLISILKSKYKPA